ncbi:hypothetical protein [Parasitella parasitica]|uniref:WRKY domain-containing protein n=1 Tax=Parasitella parasitica TaxID=35722 RepID=A0A0B7N213_9FUNG|nr:hypothetical protein [Parasitella parasitica]
MSRRAVRWIYNRHIEYSSEDEDQQQNTLHLSYGKREAYSRPRSRQKWQTKEIQKKVQKQGCLTKLKAIVYKADPANVVLITEKEHNHGIGSSLEDLQYLLLSDDGKALIETRLRKRYRKTETHFAIQQNFTRYVESNFLALDLEPDTLEHSRR